MRLIFDSVCPGLHSATSKATPLGRAYRHSATLLAAACLALGCDSAPEMQVFPPCSGPFDVPSWSVSFAADSIEVFAIDPQGAIVVAYQVGVKADAFTQELVTLNASGEVVWQKSLSNGDINWLTTNDAGDIFLGGNVNFGATSSIDGNSIPAGPFMARLRPDGTLMWVHSQKELPSIGVRGALLPLLLDDNGQLLAFGSNVATSLNPDSADLLWRMQINYEVGTWGPRFMSAAVDIHGEIWAEATFQGTIDAGGFSMTSAVDPSQGDDGFRMRLSPDGTVLDMKAFGEPTAPVDNAIAAYPAGGIVTGKPLHPTGKTRYERRDAQSGTIGQWQRQEYVRHLESGQDGQVYASGIDTAKNHHVFLEELDGQGELKWRRTFGLDEFTKLRALPDCRASALIVASSVPEGTDFGFGKIHCPGDLDKCLVVAISRP